jgi:hypothetical protein
METRKASLSTFMHALRSGCTTYFNKKRNRSGHLFQGRYKSILVDKDSSLLELSRYIHMSRAHLSDKPEDYPYSSYRVCAVYLAKKVTPLSNPEIGAYFGNITFSAVTKIAGRLKARIEEDEGMRKELEKLERKLSSVECAL